MKEKTLLLAGTFLPSLLSLLAHWKMVSAVGVESYGLLVFQLQFFSLVYMLSDFGLTTQFMAGKNDHKVKAGNTNVIMYCQAKFVMAVVGCLLLALVFPENMWLAFVGIGITFHMFQAAVYRIRREYFLFLLSRITPWIFVIISLEAIKYFEYSLAWQSYFLIYLIGFLSVTLWIVTKAAKAALVTRMRWGVIYSLLLRSFPFFVTSVFVTISSTYIVELTFLKLYGSRYELSVMSIFFQFSMVAPLLQSYLTSLFLPVAGQLSLSEIKSVMRKQRALLVCALLLLMVALYQMLPFLYPAALEVRQVLVVYYLVFCLEILFHPSKIFLYVNMPWAGSLGYFIGTIFLVVILGSLIVLEIDFSFWELVLISSTSRAAGLLVILKMASYVDRTKRLRLVG